LNIIYEILGKLKKKTEKILKNIAKTQKPRLLKNPKTHPITQKPNLASPASNMG
jgi:hypothetical protein